jgi:hypothetical protein
MIRASHRVVVLDEAMDAPCLCDQCGKWFDLERGNGCRGCKTVYCPKCVKEPFALCRSCTKERKPG